MQRDIAETVGLHALSWLSQNEDLLPVFMGATGATTEDFLPGAQDIEFLGSVLDFLMNNDDWVVEFCDAYNLTYDQPMAARQALPGGQQVNWT